MPAISPSQRDTPSAGIKEVYRGTLVYRATGSARRVSYLQVKEGLVKSRFAVEEEVPDWL